MMERFNEEPEMNDIEPRFRPVPADPGKPEPQPASSDVQQPVESEPETAETIADLLAQWFSGGF
jgi:hypothetical protein